MLIILEGPDGAGKSTLARETAELIRNHAFVEVLHAGPPTLHPIDEYEVPLVTYRPSPNHIICDRWHLGEAIYPRILGRKTRWNIAIQRHVNLFMRARGACIVLLKPSSKELRLRLAARGDDLITPGQIGSVVRAYGNLPSHYFSRRYGRDADETMPTPRVIVRLARRMHLAAAALTPFQTYVGSPKPRLLLLGDERAPAARLKQPDMPAFVPYGATSGQFLLSHLDTQDVGIANVCDDDDAFALWRTLGHPHVVTLGQRAAACADKLMIPHGSVPHPQYVRRFHHRHGDEYAHIIRLAGFTGGDMRSWRP